MISPGEINEEGIKISNSLLKSTRSALARLCPRFIRDIYHSWSWTTYYSIKYARGMGWIPLLKLNYFAKKPLPDGGCRKLHIANFPFPVWYRPGSSDPDVLKQIFGQRE